MVKLALMVMSDTETHADRARVARLSRTGVSLIRIPAGKEYFVYHSHQREEE